MFHFKRIVSACLTLAFLLASTAALAETAATEPAKPAAKKSSKSKKSSPAPAANQTAEAKPAAPVLTEAQMRQGPGDPVAGAEKAVLCEGCHGERGNSMDPLIPKLAGQYGGYIAKQVKNFQANIRTNPIMGAVAASVTNEDLADMAAYFASQPIMSGSPNNNEIGKKLFDNGDLSRMLVPCGNCHGATGKGMSAANPVFPVIGGQHKEYLLGQLQSFKKGNRNNSPGGVMNIMVQRLTDAEMEAIAEYASGL